MNEISNAPECLCADSRREESWRLLLGERRGDLLLTDPPYCLLTRRRKGGDLRDAKHRKIEGDPVLRFENVCEYRKFTEGWLPNAVARLKPAAPLVIWTNFLGIEPILATARACGYGVLAGEFEWAKRTTERHAGEQLLRVYEVALVLLREARPPLGDAEPAVPWTVAAGYDDEGEAARWGAHPNHKPFSALEALVRTWSRPGQLVIDAFAGSGSIPSAALRLGREVACMELVPEWAARVTQRLRAVAEARAQR